MILNRLFKIKQLVLPVLAVILAGAGTANAEVTKIGDFYFDLNPQTKTAVLVRNEAYTTMATVEIPDKVNDGTNDYEVTEIGQQCFQSCTAMTSIVLPNTLKTISKWAFYECSALNAITLPESLTTIDELAFQRCYALQRVELPANVQSVGKSAFTNCFGLTEFVFNDNLTAIPDGVFNGCGNLAKVTFPSKLETIGNSVFYSCGLISVELPESLKTMGYGIFSHCNQLTKATIPGNVKSLGDQTFFECFALKTVVIGDGMEHLGEAAFYNNKALTDITLPQSLKTLSSSVFYGCAALTEINLPESITAIPGSCFYECAALTKAPLSDRITEIGRSAFQGCSSITEVTIPANLKALNSNTFADCKNLTTVKLNNVLERIDGSVFFSNAALTEIKIPASVATIDGNPFIGCANLSAIEVDAGNANYASPDGVLTDKAVKVVIGYPGAKTTWVMPETIEEVAPYAFNNLPNVTDITFSPNIRKIGMSAFYNTKVKEAVFTDKLESIDATAFFMDRSLERVVFGNSDFTTGNNCLSLTAVGTLLFPESVTKIGVDANGQGFSIMGSNANLKSVWLPSTLQQFSPFGSGCNNLTKIYCWAQTPPTLVGSNKITISSEVYVPKGTVSAYQQAWGELYPNVTFKDVLPSAPALSIEENGTADLTWEPYTEEGYIGETAGYTLTLYKGHGADRTVIFTNTLNANGEISDAKSNSSLPKTITASLGSLGIGEYTVSLNGFTALGEMVLKFEEEFAVATSGIADVEQDNDAPTYYYNLQGVLIDNPEKGNIYITRKGKSTGKIVY